MSSAACKGSCGDTLPNPMDIVIMADRTTSMSDTHREQMKTAIVDSLGVMDPTLHYVAFGALHKSRAGGSCATAATSASDGVTGGNWIAVPFTNDYKADRDSPINTNSKLVKGVQCMPSGAVPGLSTGSYGTHLASSMKGAARYLLGKQPNNLTSLPKRPGTPKKVIIFETDGQPDELVAGGSTSLDNSGDLGADRNFYGNGNGKEGCDNFNQVSQYAKDNNITVLVIGFGDANTAPCEKPVTSGGSARTPRSPWVRDYLAKAASPGPSGAPSKAESDCSSNAERVAENKDGDYYFCAVSGSELGPIFATAIVAVTESIRLIETALRPVGEDAGGAGHGAVPPALRRLHSRGSSAKHDAGTLVTRVTTTQVTLRSAEAGVNGSPAERTVRRGQPAWRRHTDSRR